MSTTTSETLEQEYNRLFDERGEIKGAARAAQAMSPEGRARLDEIGRRLMEILAIPPQGYTLPKQAAGLIAHAEAHGWLSLIQWTWPGCDAEPFVTVQLAHKVGPDEVFHYKVTWSSRGCAPGGLRLSGRVAQTPGRQWHDAPSLTAIRTVIEQHPAQRKEVA